ncbi:MAG: AsmA family protein [Hyphomonadaceae bacterium]|nr:AsmA family protein [Hyphomonadaceae bacterium]
MPKTWVGWLFASFWIVLALLGAAAVGLYFFLPREQIRAQVERLIEAQIGRDVTFAGAFRPSLYPVLGFRADDVSVANVANGRAATFAAAEGLAVGVEVIPFLQGRLIVTELVLQKPAISLEIDAEGRPNWLFAPRPGAAPAPPRPTKTPPAEQDMRLHDVRIVDGLISQNDFRANVGWMVEDVDLQSSIVSLAAPMEIDGALTYRGERVELEIDQARPRALMRGEATDMAVALRAAPMVARLQGRLDPRAETFVGAGQASGESLRRVAAWLGAPMAPGAGFERFSVDGRLNAARASLSIENATMSLDQLQGRGDLLIETQRAKPYVSGRLELQALDLNPYLAPPPAAAGAAAPASAEPTGVAAGVDLSADAYDRTPVDLSGMGAFNANLELTANAFTFQRLRTERAQLSMVLNDGFLAATLHRMQLYGGAGSGRIEIDARQPALRLVQELVVDGVDVNRFLTDAAGFAQIEGRGEVGLRLVATGRSQADFMASMGGRVHVEVVTGALRGVDLGGIARTIRNALSGDLVAANARTPFTGMSATLTLSDGVAATDNLSLNTRNLAIRGIGVIDLNGQTLDLRVVPRDQGIAVPFRMQGPWAQLAYASDLRGRARPEIEAKVRAVQARARAAR